MSDNKKTNPDGFGTRCIHAGQRMDPLTGSVSVPIYATSTYQQIAPGEHKGFAYARGQNETRFAFERCLADLENGTHGFAFASGLAASNAALDLIPSNSHLIACDDLYGGSFRLFERVRKETTGLSVTYVDMSDVKNIERAIRPDTRMIWVETPSNPLMKIVDLAAIAAIATKHKILTVCDNTFASPVLQNPLNHGFDIVMHSATKYIGGHSDIIAGALVVRDQALAEKLKFLQFSTGGILGPFDSFLALRGLKSMHVRVERHCANAQKVAAFLTGHPKVAAVYFPGLKTHPGHDIAARQMKDFGGMVSLRLKTDMTGVKKMLAALRLFTLAESLGGVESLVNHPATMTHASIPKDVREKNGVTDDLIRLSVGIEDVGDLIEDLKSGFSLI